MNHHDLHDLGCQAAQDHSRRYFLGNAGYGIGAAALAGLLSGEAGAAKPHANDDEPSLVNPLAPKAPHFGPKAKQCFFIFLEGAPSHIDLYDPKP